MCEIKVPSLRIGKYEARCPIIQGGMGIMISGPRLAGAVAAAGGIGTIASVGLAVASDDYDYRKLFSQNIVMLKKAIKEARENQEYQIEELYESILNLHNDTINHQSKQ